MEARNLPQLALQFLAATDAPEHWLEHWRSRAWARNLLLKCRRRPNYVLTVDALHDLAELEDFLAALPAADVSRSTATLNTHAGIQTGTDHAAAALTAAERI